MMRDLPERGPLVQIRVLGTVTATAAATATAAFREVPLGGPRARALLSALAFGRGRIISAETLLQDVWGVSTPGVRSALRANVSRLRATQLGSFLVGGRQGYALTPHPRLQVDLWQLDSLELDELALLVDSRPFDGTGASPFLPDARTAVRAFVRRAVTSAIDAQPGHPRAVETAERLLAQDPGNVELRALLLALRAGSMTDGQRGAYPATTTKRIGLPTPIAAYLPRPEDESRLAAALRLSRLVSLVGPAGAGKSRLAVEWARGAAAACQEHIWFCRAGGSRRAWLGELARSVGAVDASVDSIVARVRPLRGTIVVDGLDDDPTAADLATVLGAAPAIAVLVTARRPLGVPGESALRVAALETADARTLFLMRSATVASRDEIDALTAALGRLPLTIELAAARAAQTPLVSVIDALTAPTPDGAADPLEAALTATLALLDAAQHETLSRLCVFRGPFTRDSAKGLCGATDAHLDALLGWSLITDESRAGLSLLRVPEIVRRHLRARDPAELLGRHRVWFAARTVTAFEELTTEGAAAAWQRLDAERADIELAFERTLEDGDRESALGIAAGLAWVGVMSGAQGAALTRARRAADVPGDAHIGTEARARLGRGILSYQLGHMEEAGSALAEAIELARRSGEPDLIALSHAFRAYLSTLTRDGTRDAIASLAIARADLHNASPSARAMVTLISAQVARSRGDHDEALRLAAAAQGLAESAGHRWALLMSGVVSAKVRLDARDPRGALHLLRGVLDDPGVLSDPISVLIATSVAAGAAAGVGADAAGARIIGAVDAIGLRYGFDPRANEPADFDRYRRRVQQGLTPEAWRDAYAHGAGLTLAGLIDEAARVGALTRS